MSLDDPTYLRRVRRHKRIVAVASRAGAVAGWLAVYVALGLALFAAGSFAWWLLTGEPPRNLTESVGLLLLLLLGVGTTELLRQRDGKGKD